MEEKKLKKCRKKNETNQWWWRRRRRWRRMRFWKNALFSKTKINEEKRKQNKSQTGLFFGFLSKIHTHIQTYNNTLNHLHHKYANIWQRFIRRKKNNQRNNKNKKKQNKSKQTFKNKSKQKHAVALPQEDNNKQKKIWKNKKKIFFYFSYKETSKLFVEQIECHTQNRMPELANTTCMCHWLGQAWPLRKGHYHHLIITSIFFAVVK